MTDFYKPIQSDETRYNRDGSRGFEFYTLTNIKNNMIFVGYSINPYKKWTDHIFKSKKDNPKNLP